MKYFLTAIISISFIQVLSAQEIESVQEVEIESAPMLMEVAPREVPTGVGTFTMNGRTGLKNHSTNTILIPAEYWYITQGDADHYIVKREAFGIFHIEKNEFVLPEEFEEINFLHRKSYHQLNEGTDFIIIVKKNGKYGLMDQNLTYVLNLEYDKIEPSSRFLKLRKDGKVGVYFLDRKAKDIPMVYDIINDSYGVRDLVAIRDGRYSSFDQTGKPIAENYKYIGEFRDQSQQRVNDKVLMIDQKGKAGIYDSKTKSYLLKVKYDAITDGFEDHFVVRKKSKYGVVAKGDQVIVPFNYDSLVFLYPRSLTSPLLAQSKKKYGLIDLNKKVVVPFQYDEIKGINNFYKAQSNGKYTVLDHSGKAITSSVFDDVGSQHHGKMAVFNDGKIGYMDTGGNIIEPIDRTSQARGYREVEMLFKGFEKVVRADNDSVLLEFCRDVVYDAYSQEFFLRIGYQYRGFPNKMIQKNITIDDAVKEYYKTVARFHQRLKSSGDLDTFEFIELKNPGFEYIEPEGLRATETWGAYKIKDRTMEIKIGELFEVDGYWKTFTNFRW